MKLFDCIILLLLPNITTGLLFVLVIVTWFMFIVVLAESIVMLYDFMLVCCWNIVIFVTLLKIRFLFVSVPIICIRTLSPKDVL